MIDWSLISGPPLSRQGAGRREGEGRIVMRQPLPLWQRIALGLFPLLLLTLLLLYARAGWQGLRCPFYELTGLYCPGCGSGRAVSAMFRGQLRQALGYNILLFLLGPPALLVLAHEYLRLVFPRLGLRPVPVPQPVAAGCTTLIFVYWIARNLPLFSILAPG